MLMTQDEDPISLLRVHAKGIQQAVEASARKFAELQQRALAAESHLAAYRDQAPSQQAVYAAAEQQLCSCRQEQGSLQLQVLALHDKIQAVEQARDGQQHDTALLAQQLLQAQQHTAQLQLLLHSTPGSTAASDSISALQEQVHALEGELAAAHSSRSKLLRTWTEQQALLQQLDSQLQDALCRLGCATIAYNSSQQQTQLQHDLPAVLGLVTQVAESNKRQAAANAATMQEVVEAKAAIVSLHQQLVDEQLHMDKQRQQPASEDGSPSHSDSDSQHDRIYYKLQCIQADSEVRSKRKLLKQLRKEVQQLQQQQQQSTQNNKNQAKVQSTCAAVSDIDVNQQAATTTNGGASKDAGAAAVVAPTAEQLEPLFSSTVPSAAASRAATPQPCPAAEPEPAAATALDRSAGAAQVQCPPAKRQRCLTAAAAATHGRDSALLHASVAAHGSDAAAGAAKAHAPAPAAAGTKSKLMVAPGIHMVSRAKDIQQLRALLEATPAWGFSLAYDTDVPGMALPHPAGRAAAAAAAAAVAEAAAGGDDWLADEQQQQQQQPPHSRKEWSWCVLGVAFCVSAGCAFYVPLTRTVKGSSSQDGGVTRVGTSARLQDLYKGLADIFSRAGSSTRHSGASSHTGIPNVAAAAAASAALIAGQPAAERCTDQAAAWGFNSSSSSSSTAGVGATYALKPQLAALASPPAASGFEGFVMDKPLVDVRIESWLLNPDDKGNEESKGAAAKRPDSKFLAALLARHTSRAEVEAAVSGFEAAAAASAVRAHELAACTRALLALQLHNALAPQLEAACAIPALMGLEMPLVRVLAAMEVAGMPCDAAVLAAQQPAVQARMAQLEQAAAALNGGRALNLGSADAVRGVLFDKLKLTPPKNAMTKGGKVSTSADVLQQLAAVHPLPGIILQHRKLAKLQDGFLKTLSSKVAELQQQQRLHRQGWAVPGAATAQAGPSALLAASTAEAACSSSSGSLVRLRGSFLQTNTATGRLSMEDPPLQTVPRLVDFQLEVPSSQAATGAGGAVPSGQLQQHQVNIRSAFAAPPGWLLLSADYSQIELRLMAHFSGDPQLLAALAPHQQDPFVTMAAQWLKVTQEQVTPSQRHHAKRLAYAMLYGMGPQSLAAELGVGVEEARQLMEHFKATYSTLSTWMAGVVEACESRQWVATLAGRRRHLPAIAKAAPQQGGGWGWDMGAWAGKAQAERQSINTTCQGSAADVVKGAMIKLADKLKEKQIDKQCVMLLQVHDELLFEVSQSAVAEVCSTVRQVLEGAKEDWGLAVCLPVKLAVGPSWGQLQEYDERKAQLQEYDERKAQLQEYDERKGQPQ